MTERFPQHQSLEYGREVVREAMRLPTELVQAEDLVRDNKEDDTAVTNGDLAVDEYVHSQYPYGDTEVYSEERKHDDTASLDPSILQLHLDPIDGTDNFWRSYERWQQTPLQERTRLPRSGGMISLGGYRPGHDYPEWGVIGALTLGDTQSLYTARLGGKALRMDMMTGVEQELSLLPPDEEGGQVVLLASAGSVARFGRRLMQVGFLPVLHDASVANIVSIADADLPMQMGIEVPPDARVVGAFMGGCHDWDVAAGIALLRTVGGVATGRHGHIRTLGNDERGGVFAVNEEIHEKLLWSTRNQ